MIFHTTDVWSTTSGGATGASIPGINDTAIFDANSFPNDNSAIYITQPVLCHISANGFTPDYNRNAINIHRGGSLSLREDLTGFPAIYLLNFGSGNAPSLTTNNYNITVGGTICAYDDAVMNLGTSTITITGVLDLPSWSAVDGFYVEESVSLDAYEATLNITGRQSGYLGQEYYTFFTYDRTWGNVSIAILGDYPNLIIDGTGTFNSLAVYGDGTVDGVQATITGSINLSGDTPGGLYINGLDFVKASGSVAPVNCTLHNSMASGGASYTALTNNGNVDGGNNSGWISAINRRHWLNSYLLLFRHQ